MINPEQMVMKMLEAQVGNNPIAANLLNLVKQGEYQQIEQVARNLVASKGGNYDTEFASFIKSLGLK